MTMAVDTLRNQFGRASFTLGSLTFKRKLHDASRALRRVLCIIGASGIGGCTPVPVTIETEVVANLPREVALDYLRKLEPVKHAKYMAYGKRTQCQYTDTGVRRIGERPVPFEKTN